MDDLISRQAAIKEWKNDFKGYVNALDIPRDDYNGIMEYIDELPSVQPDYDKIIAEIKQCISETREHGKHHAKFVQDNGELYISGLEMALSIIEENR